MSELTMGVIGTALKESEFRAPLHPEQIPRIPEEYRKRIFLEKGYGRRFGFPDEQLAKRVGGLMSREDLLAHCDIALMPKPTDADLPTLRDGQILWGWPHCVQGPAITQAAIDKKLTVIAWEAMHIWKNDNWQMHVFQKNNEIAGYAGVLHATQLKGITGSYGRKRRAAVISFGSTGRGAVYALQGLGFHDITLFTRRAGTLVTNPIPSLSQWQFQRIGDTDQAEVELDDGTRMTMAQALGHFDIVVNCTFQDTDAPFMFVNEDEVDELKLGSLIVDISCDEGMGFHFAKPTKFSKPTFAFGGRRGTYYAVDHTPSYLWNAATYEISAALIPFIPTVMSGHDAWHKDETIRRAIELEDGVIQNEKILNFQNRSAEYPHEVQG